MAIRGLLFDKDGTLFDFRTTWSEWSVRFFTGICDGDLARATEIAGQLGFDMATREFTPNSVIIAGTPAEVMAEMAAQLPEHSAEDLVTRINQVTSTVPQQAPVPLVPLMEGFRANGLTLGVATNDAEAPARVQLADAGITGYFDFIAGYDSGFGAKPGTGMQQGFCAATGLIPGEVAMVGDSTHDLISGRAAGMVTVAVLTGIADEKTLAPYADVVLPDIGALPAWLGQG